MKRRILVAEDQEALRELLQVVLERAGYEVISASDGEEAVEKARAESPDLLFLDIFMPKLDGILALKLIRQWHPDVPAVAYTAYSSSEDIKRYKEAGFTEVLPKPASIQEIRELANRLLGQREGTQQAP